MMKIVYYFFLIPFCLFSQIDIKNHALTVPEKNFLYVGIDNVVEITGIKIDSTFAMTSNYSRVLPRENNDFIIRISKPGLNDTLKLLKNNDLVFSKVYYSKMVPEITAQLGNIKDTIASIIEILSYPTLEIVIPEGSYIRNMVHVTNFKIQIISNNPQINSEAISCVGNIVPKKQRKIIKRLKAGDKIVFSAIYAQGGGYAARKLKPISITIK